LGEILGKNLGENLECRVAGEGMVTIGNNFYFFLFAEDRDLEVRKSFRVSRRSGIP